MIDQMKGMAHFSKLYEFACDLSVVSPQPMASPSLWIALLSIAEKRHLSLKLSAIVPAMEYGFPLNACRSCPPLPGRWIVARCGFVEEWC